MKLFGRSTERDVMTMSLIMGICFALCKATNSVFMLGIVCIGVISALMRRLSVAFFCWLFLVLCVVMSPVIVPKESIIAALSMRLGPFMIGATLIVVSFSMSKGKLLPLGTLFLYLVQQVLASANGLVPPVSFLKLLQFVVFLLSIWLCARCYSSNESELYKVRIMFLSIVVVIVIGSFLVLPFPTISYATSLRLAMRKGGEMAALSQFEQIREDGGMAFFSGITDHSQTLAPMLALMLVYVLADMMFVARRMSVLHLFLIVSMFFFTYLTKSRTCLLSMLVGFGVLVAYTSKKIWIEPRVRSKVKGGFWAVIALMVIAAIILEMRDGGISKWVRKTSDRGDDRSLQEAVTASRQGTIEQCLYEYRQNPAMGIGFQVDDGVLELYQNSSGLILSAPIEKGLLPLMVLGEGGIIGAGLFYCFIIAFLIGCVRNGFYVSQVCFVTFFMTNIGEATFLSPGGTGGILWMFFAVGGFALDLMILRRMRDSSGYSQWR